MISLQNSSKPVIKQEYFIMQIHFAGKLSKDDYLKGLLLHNQKRRVQKWFIGIFLSFTILYLVDIRVKNPVEFKDFFQYMFPGYLFILIIGTFPWWAPYLQWLSYNQKGNIYRNDVHGIISETGINIQGEGVEVSFQWNRFVDYKISEDVLLLYQGKNCFNMFHRKMFSDHDEWIKFISLVKEKILR
jgi:hypothetical protein